MTTPMSRPTYGGWLDNLAREGRTDVYGLVANAWLSAQANGRPKIHAPASVNKWLSEHIPPGVEQASLNVALHKLHRAYQGVEPLPAIAEPGQPVAPSLPPPGAVPFQPPVQPQLPLPQPGQAAVAPQPAPPAVPAGQQADQPAVPEHPWQMVMLAIERLRSDLAPLLRLVAESEAADQALAASALLSEPSEAQQRALAIAQEQGWTPGPAFADQQPAQAAVPAQPVAGQQFYQHAVQPPNYAQMAADVETADDMQPGAEAGWSEG